jgi:hypothetical protein
VADDFTIPSGWWYIDRIGVGGEGAYGPDQGFDIKVYADDGGSPGTIVYAAFSQPYELQPLPGPYYISRYTVSLTDPFSIPAGTYWMSVQFHSASADTMWWWAQVDGSFDHTSVIRGNPGFCQFNGWTPVWNCLPTDDTDMYFELFGTGGTSSAGEDAMSPSVYSLAQNFPNPFNPTTTIEYTIPSIAGTGHALSLQVFDLLGRRVATVMDGPGTPGHHHIVFDASGLPSGSYFYRLQAGSFVQTRMMLLVK